MKVQFDVTVGTSAASVSVFENVSKRVRDATLFSIFQFFTFAARI